MVVNVLMVKPGSSASVLSDSQAPTVASMWMNALQIHAATARPVLMVRVVMSVCAHLEDEDQNVIFVSITVVEYSCKMIFMHDHNKSLFSSSDNRCSIRRGWLDILKKWWPMLLARTILYK